METPSIPTPTPASDPDARPMLVRIRKHPDHNRYFIAILDDGTFLECEVRYMGGSSGSRAVVLDNSVMPVLFEKLK